MPRKNAKILDGLDVNLRFLKEIGVEDLNRSVEGKAVKPGTPKPAPHTPQGGGDGTPKPAGSSELDELHTTILACRLCGLAEGRTRAVPGEGNPRAELMFVGEGPGRDEDEQGRPFVGRAGQLLTKIIAAMGYGREQVFIANIVKCRPPDNRVPLRGETAACTPYLLRQIELIGPKVIVALGKTATEFFLPDAVGSMTSIRGRFYDWKGIRIMPTFHPSYLIRNEGNKGPKKMVWDDMKLVMTLLTGP
ncbi:MAG: uracil-DNA glycosylase [Acidobacteriota bacterium]|nr:uracil-DNA glycosylase [Acidobacteriota bacterium]